MHADIDNRVENSQQNVIAGLKVNIGCGGAWQVEGWIGIDQKTTAGIWQKSDRPQFIDLNVKDGLPFPANSLDVVFSSHTLEHFTYEEGTALLFEIYRVLKIGAPLCLVVPDMDLYISNYINRNKEFLTTPEIIGGTPRDNLADNFLMNFYSDPGFNNTCHKYGYNFENLSSRLKLVGFENIQKVDFHDFTYWPELKESAFRSPIPHIERFSLCVQCKKNGFDPNYQTRAEYLEAKRYSRFREKKSDLAQQLNSALLLNAHLTAQHSQLTSEHEKLQNALNDLSRKFQSVQSRLIQEEDQKAQLAREREQAWQEVDKAKAELAPLIESKKQSLAELEVLKTANDKLLATIEQQAAKDKKQKLKLERLQDKTRDLRAELDRQAELHSQRVKELKLTSSEAKLALQASLSQAKSSLLLQSRLADRNATSLRWLAPHLIRSVTRWPSITKQNAKAYSLIKASGLFDADWYLRQYPDVAQAGVDPLKHYIRRGGYERRNPNPEFDSEWYLTRYPDVAQAGLNPLVHYLEFGAAENRLPLPGTVQNSTITVDVTAPPKTAQPGKQQPGIIVADKGMQTVVELSQSAGGRPATVSQNLYSPLISILIPTYNTPSRFLREVVQSIMQQDYSAWELCIVDDGSTDQDCLKILRELSSSDSRIRVAFSEANEGIAVASQKALEMATGEFVAFVDHDDILAANALSEVVQLLREDINADMIYTDHAMMADNGTLLSAALKPDWSPEFFLCTNYIVHFKVLRRSLVLEVGGFKDTIAVAQDIGLTCKVAETNARIRHLPKVLYYWRLHQGSVSVGTSAKPEIEKAAMQTYNGFLKRQQVDASVVWPDYFKTRRIGAYKLDFSRQVMPRTAIIVPIENEVVGFSALCADLAESGFDTARDLHVISLAKEIEFPADLACQAYRADTQQAFNKVVSQIDCEVLVFLSPGAVLISKDWLQELVGYLSVSSRIGAVGGKVLNQELRVTEGGALLMNWLMPICQGEIDGSDGHWHKGRIASNVEVVSSRLLATRKSVYQETGGLEIFDYLNMAGAPYCLRLRDLKYRIVYNPWSKIVDTTPEQMPVNFNNKLKTSFGEVSKLERYYHPFFSKEAAYSLDGN